MSSEIDNYFKTLKGGTAQSSGDSPNESISDVDNYFAKIKTEIPKPVTNLQPVVPQKKSILQRAGEGLKDSLYGPAGIIIKPLVEKVINPAVEKITSIPAVQKPIVALAERTSGTGLYATAKSISPNITFKQAYDKAKEYQSKDPSKLNNFLYQLVDSAPQTALGVALNFVPFAGKPLSTAYWTAISSADQIKNKGKVSSVGNVAIDVLGDRLLGNSLESLFKKPATTLVSTMVKGGITEGGTEVAQDMLKFANDYKNAKTPAERTKILTDAKKYITSGQILMTAGVGGITGSGIAGAGHGMVGIQNKDEVRVSPETQQTVPGTTIQTPSNIQPVVPGTTQAPGTVQTQDTIAPGPTFATPQIPVTAPTTQSNASPEIAQFFETMKQAPVQQTTAPIEKGPEFTPTKTLETQPAKVPTAKEIAEETVMANQNVGEAAKTSYRSAHQLSLDSSVSAHEINIPVLKEKIRERNGYLNKFNISDLKKLEKLQNNPDGEVTIYRASPVNELNDGDWVTTDKTYANDIKRQNGGKVYSYTVKVKDLRFPKDTETLPSLSMASTFSYSPKTTSELQQKPKQNEKELVAKKELPAKKKVDKEEVARLEQSLREDYMGNEKVEEELYKLYTRLEVSKAGYRYITGFGADTEVRGVGSTFPKWIPEKFRSKALFEKIIPTLEDIQKVKFPEGNRPAQREFYNLLLDALDTQLGTDTSSIRGKILEQYGENKTNGQETNDLVAQSIERGESPSDAEIETTVDEYFKSSEDGTIKKAPEQIASSVYERMKAENPAILDEYLNYDEVKMKEDFDKATELISKDKQKAYNIAIGAIKSPDITQTAVNIVMAEKALEDGNLSLYTTLIKNRSLAQTRRGQEIVMEKGSINDNTTSKYVKELLNTRLETLGKRYLEGLKEVTENKEATGKKSSKAKAVAKIDEETTKAQKSLEKKKLSIKKAQEIIDKLTCK